MLNFIIISMLAINLWAPYIGSWIPEIAGAPAGAVIRDIVNAILFGYAILIIFLKKCFIYQGILLPVLTWLALLMWVLALMLFSPNLIQAIMGARSYILFPSIFIIVVIVGNSKNSYIDRDLIINFLVFFAVTSSLIAILDVAMMGFLKTMLGYRQDYAGDNFSLIDSYDGRIRATGGFSDALNFSYYLAISLLVSMQQYHEKRKTIFIISAMIIFVCIVMTLTRGAVLCAIVIFIFYLFVSCSYRNIVIKYFFAASCLFLICIYSYDMWSPYIELMVERFTDSSSTSKGSTMGRVTMALAAIKSLMLDPIGVGLGTQGSGNLVSSSDLRVNTDNYFFWMALETGVIGLLLNLVFLSTCFISAFSLAGKNRANLVQKSFLWLMLFCYVFSAAVSSAPSSSTFSIVFWMVMALVSLHNKRIV